MKRCVACRINFSKIKQDLYHNEDSLRIMKCSRITLFDRKQKLSKDGKHNCNFQRENNPELQNYLSWLNKPHSVHDEDRPYLTVCNLVLPSTAPVLVDSGARSERWVKKRPRLQSAKVKNLKSPHPKTQESDSSDDEPNYRDDNTETDSQLMEIQQVMEEYEIDENVQRLIQEAAEYDQRAPEEKELKEEKPPHNDADELDKRKHRKSSKNKTKERNNETKEKARSKLTRTVTLSLSRPPSPETIQVIRVDVTSNYSMEELDNKENGDGEVGSEDGEENEEGNAMKYEKNQLASNRLYAAKSLIKQPNAGELTLQCQRLALADRRAQSGNDAK